MKLKGKAIIFFSVRKSKVKRPRLGQAASKSHPLHFRLLQHFPPQSALPFWIRELLGRMLGYHHQQFMMQRILDRCVNSTRAQL